MRAYVFMAALAALALASWSCSVNEYPLCPSCPDAGQILDGNGTRDGSDMGDGGDDTDGDVITDGGSDVDACPTGTYEICDRLDNDCDGNIDEGSIQGAGTPCGSDVGECVAGLTQCVAGELVCSGVAPRDEVCDGLDNDCDDSTDESIPPNGACGLTDEGECSLGQLQCMGGVFRCTGAVYPSVEQCDALDQDCDGDPLNGFNLLSDSRNCGACGNVCQAANAITRCDGTGNCALAVCAPSYWNLNGLYADGCEYGPCAFQSFQEGCNQSDDDCDGTVDESLAPPNICLTRGACGDPAPVLPTCTTAGWRCEYGPDVQVDGNGDIVPETLCDDIDNDCDGVVDEGHPQKGSSCDDGNNGVCRSTGTYVCDAADPSAPVTCAIDMPGQPAGAETCNNLDDDCDGTIDEGDVRSLVDIGGGVRMFAHEASRPDATDTSSGTVNTRPCSHAGALPWTNIKQPDAEAACASIGGRLCTEFEWQRACKVVSRGPDPVPQGGATNYLVFIEAEDYVNVVARNGKSWLMDTSTGYSGSAALRALPNTGNSYDASYATNSPRLDYRVQFSRTGTHYVWVRGWGPTGSDDTVHVGINGVAPATSDRMQGFPDAWTWSNNSNSGAATINVPSVGTHTINVWMREDGFRIDALLITSNSSYVPTQTSPSGCEWSYGANCNTYSAATCNGLDHDSDPATTGNQDDLTTTGELAACYANWGASGRLYDMSGNVKEWTAERLPGVNPLRGGSSTSTDSGITCDYSFTVADDDFFFPNVGFRCCL